MSSFCLENEHMVARDHVGGEAEPGMRREAWSSAGHGQHTALACDPCVGKATATDCSLAGKKAK